MAPIQLTSVIVDDESSARRFLKEMLQKYGSFIKIVGEADCGMAGIAMINDLVPDIVFLDIQLKDKTGFDILKAITYQPYIVFVTAYDQFAVKAFESYSIDYLLKPVEQERFDRTIDKIRRFIQSGQKAPSGNGENIFASGNVDSPIAITTLSVKNGNRISLIAVADISFLEASDKYSYVHFVNGERKFSDHNLSVLETRLPDYFLRVQKSYIINKKKILEVRRFSNYRFQFVLADKDLTTIISGPSYWSGIKKEFF